jgi:hypothetical protein
MDQRARGSVWALSIAAVLGVSGAACALPADGAGPDGRADASSLVPRDYRDAVGKRMAAAGANRSEINESIAACPEGQREGMAFLLANMPETDLASLSSEFLLKNVSLAYEAREKHPWAKGVPKEIFLDAVLPYANVNEKRDDWRGDFVARFAPAVKDCKTATEAAQLLNREVFKALGVKYHATKRIKPDQSPYESKEIGYSSCTGLSIILADACRAVGIPARVVGTPQWADDSGNHTWVEFWDGQWWYLGAAEPGPVNETWFSAKAAKADGTDPHKRIYAASFRKTEMPFEMIWSPRRDISAVDVSSYYVHRQKLGVSTVDADGKPAPATIRLVEGGRIVGQAEGATAKFEVGAGEEYVVRAESEGLLAEARVNLPAHADASETLRFGAAREVLGSADTSAGDPPASPTPPTAAASPANSETIASLKAWLARPRAERGSLSDQTFAGAPLSKEDAAAAQKLLWDDHAERIRAEREAEWSGKEIEAAGKKMKFLSRTFGEKPASGWNLYISMHGGGNAAPEVNDSQWKNQIKLYQPKNSLYIAPRAPTNTWNLWHEAHIDALFDRMIEDAIVLEGVDPNHVYIMGYSAGGDGVYQLAPRMADRLAAASMMAGHPNDASPLGLRNIGFTIHVGALDNGYDRNKVAEKWKGLLDDLRKDDPKGYAHEVQLHEGRSHWMNLEDKVAVDWMAKFTRDPLPERVVWKQSSVTHDQFYWLAMPKGEAKKDQLVVATRAGQRIEIEKAEGVKTITILLNDKMVDLDQPVIVAANGKTIFEGKATRTIGSLSATLDERGDPMLVFPARVTVEIGAKP